MFDLITGKVQHVPSTPAVPILVSTSIQGTALAIIVLSSLLYATRDLPPAPDMMAFVGMPAAAPPPPPPPPAPATPQAQAAAPKPVPVNTFAAPIEAPAEITPEPATVAAAGDTTGVPGGVEGGIATGIVAAAPAVIEGPPPPPAPVPHERVHIGGQIQAPAMVRRVEPIYPQIAQFAAIDGVVILDATVDESGRVQTVKVLRGHPLLAKAATDAVKQWIYEPLRLNGVATPFELTVSLWFHFDDKPKRRS